VAAPAENVTRALHRDASGISPVVGWLVCIEGPDRGQDYRLHSEKNFIGRARNMDIAIAGDDSISRERHAIVLFDPKKSAFWIQPGDASGLTYVNGEMVHSPTPLKADDVIELGRTKLVLAPFVGEKYKWT
jgi:pSer/pThr/pTyr-binding forkhead associated (FHA) protein